MNIDVPGLTPEMCQARADYMRDFGWTPAGLRSRYHDMHHQVLDEFDAAIVEQFPPKPELRVGDLATVTGTPARFKLVALDGDEAWLVGESGSHFTRYAHHLAPTGEPAPDDWGQ